MVIASFLPFLIFGLLALAPSLSFGGAALDDDLLPDPDENNAENLANPSPNAPEDATDSQGDMSNTSDSEGESVGASGDSGAQDEDSDSVEERPIEAGNPADGVTDQVDDEGDSSDQGTAVDPIPDGPFTRITIADLAGVSRSVELSGDDFDGLVPDISASDGPDIISVDEGASQGANLLGLAGDDQILFGYGISADPGEGDDSLTLAISGSALEEASLAAGTVVLSDRSDALKISIDPALGGHIHEVQINQIVNPNLQTEIETARLFYVHAASATLALNEQASLNSGQPVFPDEGEILVQIELGSVTTFTSADDDGNPLQEVTGALNSDPAITLDRAVTSQTVL